MVTKKDISVLQDVSASSDTDKKPETVKKPESIQPTDTHKDDEYVKWVYAGPTLPNGTLQSNAILSGRISDILDYYKDVVVKYPQIVKLIVPLHKFSEIASKAKVPGNIINKYYTDIASSMMQNEED